MLLLPINVCMNIPVSGAAQADVAILVVNATRGEFETGFESGGQTREHALLARSLGWLNPLFEIHVHKNVLKKYDV